ncbi:hypothetical protein SSX86_017483 [Deinandra increscens subsp. villosa]|uniref:Transmembrane protein n=1 Tax=Deinandra increscens subsp. villosa TaxID=3103831 RepID=A0AAP0GX28_9ASTR
MEDNEWESIHPSTSASQSDEDDAGTGAVVLPRPTNFTVPPFSPPTNHEPLPGFPQHDPPHEPETQSPPSSYSSSTTSYTTDVVENEPPQPPEATNTLLNASLGILSSWVLRIAYGIRSRIGLVSIASVASFVTLTAYARRWQRRRRLAEKDKLLILLNQKDEKIKQLLLQIERMKETISARRRVPVFRVVVDSPLVVGPRLN